MLTGAQGGGRDGLASADAAEKRRIRRKRRRRTLIALLIVAASCTGVYFLLTSEFFDIEEIDVAGEKHYTSARIVEIAAVPDGSNMFETDLRELKGRLEKDPYIEKAVIERKPPHKIKITVTERTEEFVVLAGEEYAVLDWSGMVLRRTDQPPALTVVENLLVKKTEPGHALVCAQDYLLADSIKLLKAVEASGLFFKRVVASDVAVRAYIYDTFSCKGTFENLTANITPLKSVLMDLDSQGIERGTVIVNGNGTCTFSPEEDA
jgi:hypothetical protein